MRRTLAILCTAAPFVAATIAALGVRHDLRMAWMALASTALARLVSALTPETTRATSAVVSLALGTAAASGVALFAGARAPFGIVAVALVLSVFSTAGAYLYRPDGKRAADPGPGV